MAFANYKGWREAVEEKTASVVGAVLNRSESCNLKIVKIISEMEKTAELSFKHEKASFLSKIIESANNKIMASLSLGPRHGYKLTEWQAKKREFEVQTGEINKIVTDTAREINALIGGDEALLVSVLAKLEKDELSYALINYFYNPMRQIEFFTPILGQYLQNRLSEIQGPVYLLDGERPEDTQKSVKKALDCGIKVYTEVSTLPYTLWADPLGERFDELSITYVKKIRRHA